MGQQKRKPPERKMRIEVFTDNRILPLFFFSYLFFTSFFFAGEIKERQSQPQIFIPLEESTSYYTNVYPIGLGCVYRSWINQTLIKWLTEI